MKRFFKFIAGIVSLAAVSFGAYCVYKKVSSVKESDEDKEDDDFDSLFEEEIDENKSDREYVSIHITEPKLRKDEVEEDAV